MKSGAGLVLFVALTSCVLQTETVPGPKGLKGDPGPAGPWASCGGGGDICYGNGSVAIGTEPPNVHGGLVGTYLTIAGTAGPQQYGGLELVNTQASPAAGDEPGEILFVSKNSSNKSDTRVAAIYSLLEGTEMGYGLGASLIFSTKSDTSSSMAPGMEIASYGNVGIGVAPSQAARLTVYDDSDAQQMLLGHKTNGLNAYIGVDASNVFRIKNGSLQTWLSIDLNTGYVDVPGSIQMKGTPCCVMMSDARLKQNIAPLTSSLARLLRLRGVTFEWKEPDKHGNLRGPQIGMIAQEVEKIFPEWVGTGHDGYKTLSYRGFEALAVESLRELKAENDRNAETLRDLKAENDRLIASNAEVERQLKAEREARLGLEARLQAIEAKLGRLGPAPATTSKSPSR